jgi:hypothetical protein
MASEKQIAANRRNALKSTGPKSADGKLRSSRNAYRHGLSVRLPLTEEMRAGLEELVRALVDDPLVPLSVDDAERVALTELEIQRARDAKNALIMARFRQAQREHSDGSAEPSGEPKLLECVVEVLPDLQKIDRYQRRPAGTQHRICQRILRERKAAIRRRGK